MNNEEDMKLFETELEDYLEELEVNHHPSIEKTNGPFGLIFYSNPETRSLYEGWMLYQRFLKKTIKNITQQY